MHELQDKYAARGVEFLTMYVREPHAGERGFPGYCDHESFEHKMEVARELVALKGMTITVGVDDMSQEQHAGLGNLPNMVFVVDRAGTLAYSNTWLHAEEVDAVLARLVTADEPSRPVQPTVTTRGLGTDI
jgi:hypothetical protein